MSKPSTIALHRWSRAAALAVTVAAVLPVGHAGATAADEQITVTGLDTPESAVHDPLTDTYLVSNIGGALPAAAFAADGNGFISKIAPDGTMLDREWIGLGRNGVVLNSPKGLALSGRGLFVADIDVVHEFDRVSGELIRTVEVPGADFLNDVARGPRGSVYVSDTALALGADGASFEPTENDAIYQITSDGRLKTVVKDPTISSPNGLTVDRRGRLLVVSFDDSKEVFSVNRRGDRRTVRPTPVGQLDGLEQLDDGSFVVSSFESVSVVRVPGSGDATTEFSGPQVADLGVDHCRGRLLLPLIVDNALVIEPLS
jgi:sugar lactone lactonase YvrE